MSPQCNILIATTFLFHYNSGGSMSIDYKLSAHINLCGVPSHGRYPP